MQTAMIRCYRDPDYSRLAAEAPVPREEALERILAGFRAALDMELDPDAACDLGRSLFVEWAGYDPDEPWEPAAPIGQQHVTRVRLRPAVGGHRYEYSFPGGLSIIECEALCYHLISDGEEGDRERELLVTGSLAGMLHAEGVSLSDEVVALVHGEATMAEGFIITPVAPPSTLHAAVRARGWAATAEWLRDTQATIERAQDMVRDGSAVWVPIEAPRRPWEPLLIRPKDGHEDGCLRLALDAEAAAYAGRREELTVSADERADWLTDREAASVAGMSQGRWRRWIETHREVRIGRPVTRDGRRAGNRRLVHKGDLYRALGLARGQDGEDICRPDKCPQRCFTARQCPHRDRDCPPH
jgi:hypothetical protein